jgi:hypothetical protein
MATQEEYVKVRNYSEVDQYVFDEEEKRRWEFPANSVMVLPKRIVTLFLNQRGKYVRPYQPIQFPDIPGPKTWVANMTGNPFAEASKVSAKGENVPNPNLKARILSWKMRQDQESERDKDGFLIVTNLPPVTIEIPPYTRIEVPTRVAEFLEARDGHQDPESQGRVMLCRGVTEFEPNMSWRLDDIRIYAYLVDKKIDIIGEFKAEELHPKTNIYSTEETKQALMRMLFFRLVDERFPLPTREEFALAKGTAETNINKEPKIESNIPKRGPGRPRKDENAHPSVPIEIPSPVSL